MISTKRITQSLIGLGYHSQDVHADYRFAAVDTPSRDIRTVQVAAFLDGPASYKTAALAVISASDDGNATEDVANSRALGAPYLIVLNKSTAAAWTYTIKGPTKIEETSIARWEYLLKKKQALFAAGAIRQLKLIRLRSEEPPTPSLFDFDPAMLRSIQADTQSAVYELLQKFLGNFQKVDSTRLSLEKDYETLFPMTFRLLAAKILFDRQDARIQTVDFEDIAETLASVEALYTLSPLQMRWNAIKRNQVAKAWIELRDGLFVRNIAADDLAFVYEHVLITPEVRQKFGTHSTPPSVADYVVRSFNLPDSTEIQSLKVYEPFAGSCVFLTAALRRFKELLPHSWSPKRTHDHLVRHFCASEIDPFACEIARLSLILADYPNHNGWHVENEDLFNDDLLQKRVGAADIVICNPPFEDFTQSSPARSIHKPLAALSAIMGANPSYLGIVMPDGLSTNKKFRHILESVVSRYRDVEVLRLPEGVFRHAGVGAEVLIAQNLRKSVSDKSETLVRSSEVGRAELRDFEYSLRPTTQVSKLINPAQAPGLIGLMPLRDLWEELSSYPRLGSVASIHRGLEWNYDQANASRSSAAAGYSRGLHRFVDGGLAQFRIGQTTYLDRRPTKLRGGANKYHWDQPKVICSAARTSRGHWRLAAAVDKDGLVVSQQFFGIWLNQTSQGALSHSIKLLSIAAILNSPLSNAFSFCHDSQQRLRVETMKGIPLPRVDTGSKVIYLVDAYLASRDDESVGPLFQQGLRSASSILMEIDALILAAYDLPPRLERELLRFMSVGERPCQHDFPPYPGISKDAGALPLLARLSVNRSERVRAWGVLGTPFSNEVSNVFEII